MSYNVEFCNSWDTNETIKECIARNRDINYLNCAFKICLVGMCWNVHSLDTVKEEEYLGPTNKQTKQTKSNEFLTLGNRILLFEIETWLLYYVESHLLH